MGFSLLNFFLPVDFGGLDSNDDGQKYEILFDIKI